MAKITILGAGGFGVRLAIAAFQNGHTVTVWEFCGTESTRPSFRG